MLFSRAKSGLQVLVANLERSQAPLLVLLEFNIVLELYSYIFIVLAVFKVTLINVCSKEYWIHVRSETRLIAIAFLRAKGGFLAIIAHFSCNVRFPPFFLFP